MKIVHVTIQTDRFEEEIQFYEKYAGLTIQRDMRSFGKDLVFLGDNEESTMIEIIRNQDAADAYNANLSLGFSADDLDSVRERIDSAGLSVTPFITPNPGVKFFYVRDPAGVNVQFIRAFYLEK